MFWLIDTSTQILTSSMHYTDLELFNDAVPTAEIGEQLLREMLDEVSRIMGSKYESRGFI
jgi:hypothetical protein